MNLDIRGTSAKAQIGSDSAAAGFGPTQSGYGISNTVEKALFGVGTGLGFVGTNSATSFALLTNNSSRITILSGGNVGIGTTTPTNPLQMASGAHVTAGGVWTDASSRTLKQDIQELTAAEARIAFEQLAPVRYTSRIDPTERHVGFIAEDVPDLVATKDRKALSPMDIVAVLTRVVQEQQKTIAELAAKIEALQATQDNPRASGLDTPTGLTTHRQ